MSEIERYVFEAEWYDKVASVLKKFYLYYFPCDNTVELFDLNTKKTFLRRTKCDGIERKDFFIDGIVNIFSRNIKITNYADNSTKQKLTSVMIKTCLLIKPDTVNKTGEILIQLTKHNIYINNIKMIKLSEEDVVDFYKGKRDDNLHEYVKHMSSGPLVVLELSGENVITRCLELIGPSDYLDAKTNAPYSLRACYGKDNINDAVYASENQEQAIKDLKFFFSNCKPSQMKFKSIATLQNCTCCIIKPHAIQGKNAGYIIDDIQKAGFVITALQQFMVDLVNCEEFFEVYKGILPEYKAMVAQLQSGPCIAMEIKHNDFINVVPEFRKLCGPIDPEICKKIRPNSLRAKYSKSKVLNAVHCSDLDEDGILEVEYFFKILNYN